MCPSTKTVLDVSCGIGTQALGLAQSDLHVTASDLSSRQIDRAKKAARDRGLSIKFSVADMRQAFTHHNAQFDLVLSFDNSLPHLLTDQDIHTALHQFFLATQPGGSCMVSVRDYEAEDTSKKQLKPYGIRDVDGVRWIGWQVWEPVPSHYQVSLYFLRDDGSSECKTHVMRAIYNPIRTKRLLQMMRQAGFIEVERIDGAFYQPVLHGRRPAQQMKDSPG